MCYCNSRLNEFSFDPLLQFLKFLYLLQMMEEILEFDPDEDIKKKKTIFSLPRLHNDDYRMNTYQTHTGMRLTTPIYHS